MTAYTDKGDHRHSVTKGAVALTNKRARWGALGQALWSGPGLALPNGHQLASLRLGPNGRARASFWVGASSPTKMRDHCEDVGRGTLTGTRYNSHPEEERPI